LTRKFHVDIWGLQAIGCDPPVLHSTVVYCVLYSTSCTVGLHVCTKLCALDEAAFSPVMSQRLESANSSLHSLADLGFFRGGVTLGTRASEGGSGLTGE